ncbi:MAG: YeeE/YedE family protein [Marinilabiliales bacterium]|nr:YeeE/YedE family protein [Marinilabiliales bacterium]
MPEDFFPGPVSGRLKLKVEKSPKITVTRRLIFAFLGGVLFVYGGQLARGCTSGAALSGMAVLSLAGFVTMIAIFGSAYLLCMVLQEELDIKVESLKVIKSKVVKSKVRKVESP